MLSWIAENIYTIIICIVLIAIVASVTVNIIRNTRNGKTSCGCGCSGCPMNGSCHSKK
ncbi:MAG: FeoB-associated Cys-rich membrane protein [Oscillospiraceae bacterium]